jgi:hypothetical protein
MRELWSIRKKGEGKKSERWRINSSITKLTVTVTLGLLLMENKCGRCVCLVFDADIQVQIEHQLHFQSRTTNCIRV